MLLLVVALMLTACFGVAAWRVSDGGEDVTGSASPASIHLRLYPSSRARPYTYGLALHRRLRLDGSGTGGIQKMRNLGIVVLGAALAGCASSAADIAPAYVSPVAYQSYTCQQLALEAQAISTRAATLSGAQDSQRTKDGVATAAAIVIFWPAAFFVGGDKQTAAELSQMKGQMVAVEQASIVKKCGIQFQGPRPPGT